MNVFIDVRDRLKMLVRRNKKLKYFPRLEKPIVVPALTREETWRRFKFPVQREFAERYAYMFEAITHFNALPENLIRLYKTPSYDEIKAIAMLDNGHFRQTFELYEKQQKKVQEYKKQGTWEENFFTPFSMEDLIERYWVLRDENLCKPEDRLRYQAYMEAKYPGEPHIPPFSEYTKGLKEIVKLLKSSENLNYRRLYRIVCFYEDSVPWFPDFKDEKFVMMLRQARKELGEFITMTTYTDFGKRNILHISEKNNVYILPKTEKEDEGIFTEGHYGRPYFRSYPFTVKNYSSRDMEFDVAHFKDCKQRLFEMQRDGFLWFGYIKEMFYPRAAFTMDYAVTRPYEIKDEKGHDFNLVLSKGNNPLDKVLPCTFDRRIVELAEGKYKAEIMYCNYIFKIYNCVETREENFEFLAKLSLDDFLVRCLGFHKVVTDRKKFVVKDSIKENKDNEETEEDDKYKKGVIEEQIVVENNPNWEDILKEYKENGWTVISTDPKSATIERRRIITSNTNWKRILGRYIENGWRIEFVPPIKMIKGRLVEAEVENHSPKENQIVEKAKSFIKKRRAKKDIDRLNKEKE